MDRITMVEELRQKTGISYEQARQELEAANWDLLEALVRLERAGKMDNKQEEKKMEQATKQSGTHQAEGLLKKGINWLMQLLDAGNRSHFIVRKEDRQVLEVPVTVAVLLLLVLHWILFPVLLVGLILGYRYSYRGRKENEAIARDVKEAEVAAEQINHHHTVNSFPDNI